HVDQYFVDRRAAVRRVDTETAEHLGLDRTVLTIEQRRGRRRVRNPVRESRSSKTEVAEQKQMIAGRRSRDARRDILRERDLLGAELNAGHGERSALDRAAGAVGVGEVSDVALDPRPGIR